MRGGSGREWEFFTDTVKRCLDYTDSGRRAGEQLHPRSYHSAAHDIGAKAASMDQSAHGSFDRQFFQMRAWIAQSCPAQDHLADGELSIDEMIERDASSDEVASGLRCIDVDLIFSSQCLDGFDLDQSHFAARARSLAVAAGLAKVTISFESFTGNRLNFSDE